MIGDIWRKTQLAHMKLCASRAFWLAAYPSQRHEMLFDAHTRCLTGLGGVTKRDIYDRRWIACWDAVRRASSMPVLPQ